MAAVAPCTCALRLPAAPFRQTAHRSRRGCRGQSVQCRAGSDEGAQSQRLTRRYVAAAFISSPILLAAAAGQAKSLKEAEQEKEARRKALKEKAQGTKETGKPFEGEEFGSNYTPPESQKISPAFLKSI